MSKIKTKKRNYVNDIGNKAFNHYFEIMKIENCSWIQTEKDMLNFYKMRSKAEFIRKMDIDERLTAKDLAEGNFNIQWCEVI